MGLYTTIYVSPVIKFKPIFETVRVNSFGCKEHGTIHHGARYCPKCGTLLTSYIKEVKQGVEKFEDLCLYDAFRILEGNEYVTLIPKDACYKTLEENQVLDITPEYMEKYMSLFNERYKDEIAILRRHIPDLNITISVIYDYS